MYDSFKIYFYAKRYVKVSEVEAKIEAAKEAYYYARVVVKKSGGSKKNYYLSKLDSYKKYINRAEGYTKGAHNGYYDAKGLNSTYSKLVDLSIKGDNTGVKNKYNELEKAINTADQAIKDTIYGAEAEKLVKAKYTQNTKNLLAADIKVYYYYDKALYWINKGDLVTAKKRFAAVKALYVKMDKTTELGKATETFVKKVEAAYEAAQVPQIESLQATNNISLSISGIHLHNLKGAQITIEENKVNKVSVSVDGKSAIISLDSRLALNRLYKVYVNTREATKDFQVKYTYEVKKIEVATTHVDDMENQIISFHVNGMSPNLDFLINEAGYNVEYQASKAIFKGSTPSTMSSNGLLNEDVLNTNDNFKVKVVLTKDGKVYSSELKEITVVNLNTPEIGSVSITNFGGNKVFGDPDDFVMNSSALVAGEAAQINSVLSITADPILVSGGFVYKSSNVGVATVDANGIIHAIAPGTTNITVISGTRSYTKSISVSGSNRRVSTLTPSKSSYTLAKGTTGFSVPIAAKDQYGDPIIVTNELTHRNNVVESSDLNISRELTTDAKGIGLLKVDAGPVQGTYPIYLRANGAAVTSFKVIVTNETLPANLKIESENNNLDLDGNKHSIIKVNEYTESGGYIGSFRNVSELSQSGSSITIQNREGVWYTLNILDERIARLQVEAGSSDITVTGLEAGKTNLVLKDIYNRDVAYFDLSVTNSNVSVTSINWKDSNLFSTVGRAIKLGDALSITKVRYDDIITGLTLSKTTTSKVRVDEDNINGTSNAISLYLDRNDNGTYDIDDIVLGSITAFVDPLFVKEKPLELNSIVMEYVDKNMLSRCLEADDSGYLIFTFTRHGEFSPLSSKVLSVDVR